MNDIENLTSDTTTKQKNKMTGRVNIIGVGKENLESSITVKEFVELPSSVIVYSDEVIINPSYPPVFGIQRKANIVIPYRANLTGSVFISPENKMSGIVEVLEPPTYYLELGADKDSFVRSQIPTLNYGDAQSMVVGKRLEQNEVFRSLIKFDTTKIPVNSKIQSVKLRMFNRQLNSEVHHVGIYSVSTDWDEYGVTWINQPAIKDLLTIVELDTVGYTDIDVTDIVKQWYESPKENNGFLIRAMNESINLSEQFFTRENSSNPPYLDVEYKLDIIYSVGRSIIESSMFVNAYGESDLTASIHIPIFDDNRQMPASIHVTNFNLMLEATVVVNKLILPSVITVKRTDVEDLCSSMSIRVKGGHLPDDNLSSNLFIVSPVLPGNIRIRFFKGLKGNVIIEKPKEIEEKILESSLIVNNLSVFSNITVKQKIEDDLIGSVKLKFNIGLHSNIIINKMLLPGSILVKHYTDIQGSILVKNTDNINSSIIIPYRNNLRSSVFITHASHLSGSIAILSGYLRASIVVPFYAESIKMATMTVRVREISEINSSINIGGDNILGGYIYLF